MLNLDETNCSCGIGNLWESKKNTKKASNNMDLLYIDSISIPTRHSKSLDQLQTCSKSYFNYSLNNIICQKDFSNIMQLDRSYCCKTGKKLKNVASEHNIQTRKYFLDSEFRSINEMDNACNCSMNDFRYPTSRNRKTAFEESHTEDFINFSQMETNGALEKKYKQFNIKNLTNVKQQYQTLVKSLSHTSTDSTQNIFRTNSMQFFSPKKKVVNGINKFNSLLSKRNQNKKYQKHVSHSLSSSDSKTLLVDNSKDGYNTDDNEQHNQTKLFKKITKSNTKNNGITNGKHFDIGSTSSSTDSISDDKIHTGFNSEALHYGRGIRKVRSTSCLGEEIFPLILSGTESLPNINPKLDDRLHYPEMKYYSSSTSSATSEQSGWITSRSSSIASSTDVTNPATSAIVTNIENIQKRLLSLSAEYKRNNKDKKLDDTHIFKHKSNKFNLDIDSSNNGHIKKYHKPEKDSYLYKGKEFFLFQQSFYYL